ncbi:MAG: hypothetical protein QOD39_3236 [Mycobacterium sp.]|nr:hypothetical protein [Mycobacterium sp.]
MKNPLAAFAIAMTVVAPLLTEARADTILVSPVIAGLISSARACGPEYGCPPAAGLAPAIFGYGYRVTYYGRGYSFQPAYGLPYTQHARPPTMERCCRW